MAVLVVLCHLAVVTGTDDGMCLSSSVVLTVVKVGECCDVCIILICYNIVLYFISCMSGIHGCLCVNV